jgi:hypothetical protein
MDYDLIGWCRREPTGATHEQYCGLREAIRQSGTIGCTETLHSMSGQAAVLIQGTSVVGVSARWLKPPGEGSCTIGPGVLFPGYSPDSAAASNSVCRSSK